MTATDPEAGVELRLGTPAGLPEQVEPPGVYAVPGWADALTGTDRAVDLVAVAVGIGPDGPLVYDEEPLRALDLDVAALVEHHRVSGAAGQVAVQPRLTGGAPRAVLLVGVGDGGPDGWRRAGAALARHGRDRGPLAVRPPDDDAAREALVVGVVLGSYDFHWRSRGPAHRPVAGLVLVGVAVDDAAVLRGRVLGTAAWQARRLAAVPSHLKSPAWLAEVATTYGEAAGLGVTVLDDDALRARGFGGLLAVGGASDTPPRLIRLDYTPSGRGGRRRPHVVLVGKGITFDSGGLSIKPVEGMRSMKRDMTGGAVVLATLTALAAGGCPVRVTGLIAAAENAVGAASYRPGDVVRHYGGRTSEISNTDAEGRLVLGDAMAHAVADLEPDVLVDVATLTGAMKVALGQRTAGFFATHDGLATALTQAGRSAGEPWWRMPLDRRYEEKIASKVADADNSASPGAIAAALFLRPFAGDVPWAHLDIASVGDSPVDAFEYAEGPTGFGVRTLLTWLSGSDPLAFLDPAKEGGR